MPADINSKPLHIGDIVTLRAKVVQVSPFPGLNLTVRPVSPDEDPQRPDLLIKSESVELDEPVKPEDVPPPNADPAAAHEVEPEPEKPE